MRVYLLSFLIAILLSSCYELNDDNSDIGSINYSCQEGVWEAILADHSTANVKDSAFLAAIANMNRRPFKLDILYFEEEPVELIAVSKDHYAIRYVYNPTIRERVIDGVSIELNSEKKERIKTRIYKTLESYACSVNK